jgi:hypothetical protein
MQLDEPNAWPAGLLELIDDHHELFLNREIAPERITSQAWDAAIIAIAAALSPYSLTGWHCTRLTDAEIGRIIAVGMQLPDGVILRC